MLYEVITTVPVGAGVPDAPIEQVQVGIVGAGEPDRAASPLPGIAFPSVVVGLAGPRNGVEAPGSLAGLGSYNFV